MFFPNESRLILQKTSRGVTSSLPRLECDKRLEEVLHPPWDKCCSVEDFSEVSSDILWLHVIPNILLLDITECTYATTFSFYMAPFSHCKDRSWVLLGRHRTSFNSVIPSQTWQTWQTGGNRKGPRQIVVKWHPNASSEGISTARFSREGQTCKKWT